MALVIPRGPDIAGEGGPLYTPTARWWLTSDRTRLVPEGSPEAAFLFCIPGRPIPLKDAQLFGLAVKESHPEATKELRPQRTKQKK